MGKKKEYKYRCICGKHARNKRELIKHCREHHTALVLFDMCETTGDKFADIAIVELRKQVFDLNNAARRDTARLQILEERAIEMEFKFQQASNALNAINAIGANASNAINAMPKHT